MIKCRICSNKNLTEVIDLGDQPWGNNFLTKAQVGKEEYYPLKLLFCNDCTCVQLNHTVSKEIMFTEHTYLSGMTKTLDMHFKNLASIIDARFFSDREDKSILDIGSNDGTQLQHYKDLGYEVLGVESSPNISKLANDNGIQTANCFFNEEFIEESGVKFDLINASGVFFHLEELHSVTRGVHQGLKEDGVFVVQFIYLKEMINNLAFDQIYHEHLLYYTFTTLNTLLNLHGLEIFDGEVLPIHGGSGIAYIAKKNNRKISKNFKQILEDEIKAKMGEIQTYYNFQKQIQALKLKNLEYLNLAKQSGKKIVGMGAPVKGNTLLNYFQINDNYLDCLVEINPLRKGLFSPGSHLEVIMEDELEDIPDIYYVLAWNFREEILKNNENLIKNGVEFYFPIITDKK